MANPEDKLTFPNEVLDLFIPIWEKDLLAIEVLKHVYTAEQNNRRVTIATLAREVTTKRRVAVRGSKGKIIRYEYQEGLPIKRAKAERLVEKLVYASLLCVDESQPPAKVLSITTRGIQATLEILRKIEANKGV